MQIGKPRSTAKPTTPDELLACRMAMLGLDPHATESAEFYIFAEIRRRCASCWNGEACARDLERDPKNPVWETYCPNADPLVALAQARWST